MLKKISRLTTEMKKNLIKKPIGRPKIYLTPEDRAVQAEKIRETKKNYCKRYYQMLKQLRNEKNSSLKISHL